MTKSRLEAFSDAVIAIIITIMVLELRIPHETSWSALGPLAPTFLTYVLSFTYLGIYWNNHHHMLHLVDRVNGKILWANLHLLFWLSLIPFSTGWMGESRLAPAPTVLYGMTLLGAALAFLLLEVAIIQHQGANSRLRVAVGDRQKEKISLAAYAASVPLAFVSPLVSFAFFVLVALLWVIPDTRIERKVRQQESG